MVESIQMPQRRNESCEPTDHPKDQQAEGPIWFGVEPPIDQPADHGAREDRPHEVPEQGEGPAEVNDGFRGRHRSQPGKYPRRRCSQLLDMLLAVGQGDEHRLELRGR